MAPCLAPLPPVLPPSKKEKLQQAFLTLDDHRAALASCLLHWKEVDEYLSQTEKVLQKRLGEFSDKENSFEAKVKETQAVLDKREEDISLKEELSRARLQELRDSAVAALLDEKRKWEEEIKVSFAENTRKKNAISALEVAVDSRVAQIDKEAGAFANGCATPALEKDPAASKVVDGPAANGRVPPKDCAKDAGAAAPRNSELKLRQNLKELCEKMDADGLLKYMVERRKDVNGLRSELPAALKSASDPAALVIGSLEGYYFPEHEANQVEKKESRISANRRACILLLECLCQALAHPVLGPEFPVVPDEIRERAKKMADQWKTKMNLQGEALSTNSLDAQAFLQLLGTFRIASECEEVDLCKLVIAVARRRQTPALCRSLGLTAKMPDIVDQLANDGKQMEAISLAYAFGIMDRIEPGPLLKAYLREAKKSAQSILKTGSNSPAALNDSTTKELSALKNVLKCIEEFELESQFPSSPLQKRVIQLEKNKSDRKRVAVAVKAQVKRPRANTGTSLSHPVSAPTERSFYCPPERPQYGTVGLTSYSLALPSSFDRRNQGSYGSAYTTGSRSPVGLPASYLYAADGLASSVYGSAAFANPATNFGGYQFGSGLPPPAPAYQTPFLH